MQCLFKKVFSIEGNIGAGKSTLLSLLEKNIPNCKIIPEPVGEWKNVGGKNLLSAFYEQPSRWCFTFEINSMFSLVATLQDALQSDVEIILIERSLFSNRAFHHISYVMDKLDTMEMTILKNFFEYFKPLYPRLNGVIYVDTDVEECLRRITQRGREEEKKVNYPYLKKLEDQFRSTDYGCKILEVNGKYDLKNAQKMIEEVKKFINNN